MEKQFSEVNVGDTFVVNGLTYTKTTEVRITCCKSVNAQLVADANNKTFFQPNTVVTVNG